MTSGIAVSDSENWWQGGAANFCIQNFLTGLVYFICNLNQKKLTGLVRDLNPGPLAPKARIIPLDQRATTEKYCNICHIWQHYTLCQLMYYVSLAGKFHHWNQYRVVLIFQLLGSLNETKGLYCMLTLYIWCLIWHTSYSINYIIIICFITYLICFIMIVHFNLFSPREKWSALRVGHDNIYFILIYLYQL